MTQSKEFHQYKEKNKLDEIHISPCLVSYRCQQNDNSASLYNEIILRTFNRLNRDQNVEVAHQKEYC